MKYFLSLFLLCVAAQGISQKFSFVPEAGILLTQIDGDKLQGFHKTGFIAGIGTHYPLSNSIKIAIKTSFYRQGSSRKDPFQDKLPDGSQLEMGLSTVGLELSTLFSPIDRSFFFGFGLVHHQILNYDYNIVDNVINGPERILDPTTIASSFNNIKFYLGWSFATSYRFTIAYARSFTDILKEDFLNIGRLKPYNMSFTFSYELNPAKKKKTKGRKVRKK